MLSGADGNRIIDGEDCYMSQFRPRPSTSDLTDYFLCLGATCLSVWCWSGRVQILINDGIRPILRLPFFHSVESTTPPFIGRRCLVEWPLTYIENLPITALKQMVDRSKSCFHVVNGE